MANSKKLLLVSGFVLVGLAVVWLVSIETARDDRLAPAGEISSVEAIDRVKNLPEVSQYTTNLAKDGSKAELSVEDGGDVWNVQVFEIVKQGEDGHTATFNWYHVDKKTGTITNEF